MVKQWYSCDKTIEKYNKKTMIQNKSSTNSCMTIVFAEKLAC